MSMSKFTLLPTGTVGSKDQLSAIGSLTPLISIVRGGEARATALLTSKLEELHRVCLEPTHCSEIF